MTRTGKRDSGTGRRRGRSRIRLAGVVRTRTPAAERGSGTVLAVGILGAVVLVTALLLPLLAVLVVGQTVRAAADAAALAAADTLSGLVAGVPCQAAAEIASLDGASVALCTTVGPIASVTVTREFLGWNLRARARAGPPGAEHAPEPTGTGRSRGSGSVENGLEVAVVNGRRPLGKFRGVELQAGAAGIEVALAA